MKQVPSDKYNVAWFRLAEYISRGEKERALGVYRLLSHSLDDAAFMAQLEGDIYLSFADHATARDKYVQAAHLYEKEGRLLQAAAMYEHVVELYPRELEYRTAVVDLYKRLSIKSKVHRHACDALAHAIEHREWRKASEAIEQLDRHDELRGHLHEQLALALLKAQAHQELMQEHIAAALTIFLVTNQRHVQQFIAHLAAVDAAAHAYAVAYLQSHQR